MARSSLRMRLGEDVPAFFAAAEQEAHRLQHEEIGTGHLVLGLLTRPCQAAALLRAHGVELGWAREQVRTLVSDPGRVSAKQRFSLEAGLALKHAFGEARRLGSEILNSQHFVLGILSQKCIGRSVLERAGVDLERLRQDLRSSLRQSQPRRLRIPQPRVEDVLPLRDVLATRLEIEALRQEVRELRALVEELGR